MTLLATGHQTLLRNISNVSGENGKYLTDVIISAGNVYSFLSSADDRPE